MRTHLPPLPEPGIPGPHPLPHAYPGPPSAPAPPPGPGPGPAVGARSARRASHLALRLDRSLRGARLGPETRTGSELEVEPCEHIVSAHCPGHLLEAATPVVLVELEGEADCPGQPFEIERIARQGLGKLFDGPCELA